MRSPIRDTLIRDTIVGSNDLVRSKLFYDAVFGALGWPPEPEAEGWLRYGPDSESGIGFFVTRPFDGAQATAGNGQMITLRAGSEAEVQAFHAAALAHGGSDEGAPGTRPYYEPWFYVCYVRDPDGNKLACVFHKMEVG